MEKEIQVSVDSVTELQAAFRDAIDTFARKNNDVAMAKIGPIIIGTMFTFPWYWIVDHGRMTGTDFVNGIMAEAMLFKNAMEKNPLSIQKTDGE